VDPLDALFAGLLDDAAVFPPGNASVPDAVRLHREHRASWFAPLIGPLVVADTELAEVSRSVTVAGDGREPGEDLAVSVVIGGGAGGLVALARRELPGVAVVAAEIGLRDLDDLAGNAGRVVAAAGELDPDEVTVFVEVPYGPGWVGAVEVIEAAGLHGKIRTGGLEPDAFPTAGRLAEQLSVLIEADLPFKATAGLHRAWPNRVTDAQGRTLHHHGFLTLMMAVEALIDGAGTEAAVDLLQLDDPGRLYTAMQGWDLAAATRVRRRFHSFGCCAVTEPVDDLVALGLLESPQEGR
jgi:hypothetical protein